MWLPAMFGWGADSGGCYGGAQGGGKKVKDIDSSLNVWVGNIPPSVEWKELQNHCAKAGKVRWAEVMRKGSGCVAYTSADDAAKAISMLNGSLLGGQKIEVDVWGSKDMAQAKGSTAPGQVAKAPGFVKAPQKIAASPATKGGVASPAIPAAGKGVGGFVCGKGSGKTGKPVTMPAFTKPIADWAALFEGGDMKKVGGGGGGVAAAGGGMKKTDNAKKVWVGNLSPSTTWKVLEKHFKQAGHTTWAEAKNGAGCVAFKTAEEAQIAMASLNGTELAGSCIQVDAWAAGKGG